MSHDCGWPRGRSRRSVVTGFVVAAAMPMASAGLGAPAAPSTAEGRALHAHGYRRGAPRRLPIWRGDRA
jgi:hypothetical protein